MECNGHDSPLRRARADLADVEHECGRLRAVNAKLVEACKAMDATFSGTDPDKIEADAPDEAEALRKLRAALAAAEGGAR